MFKKSKVVACVLVALMLLSIAHAAFAIKWLDADELRRLDYFSRQREVASMKARLNYLMPRIKAGICGSDEAIEAGEIAGILEVLEVLEDLDNIK